LTPERNIRTEERSAVFPVRALTMDRGTYIHWPSECRKLGGYDKGIVEVRRVADQAKEYPLAFGSTVSTGDLDETRTYYCFIIVLNKSSR
jgi:hypothetical protein